MNETGINIPPPMIPGKYMNGNEASTTNRQPSVMAAAAIPESETLLAIANSFPIYPHCPNSVRGPYPVLLSPASKNLMLHLLVRVKVVLGLKPLTSFSCTSCT